MAVDLHKGYPHRVLEDSYAPKDGQGIVEGMMVVLDANLELNKGVGAAGEYAMLAMNNQTDNWLENANKIQVIKEGGSFCTDQYKTGPAYAPHAALQVSTVGGEEGLITLHAGGASPIVGRFIKWTTIYDKQFMVFDLVRE